VAKRASSLLLTQCDQADEAGEREGLHPLEQHEDPTPGSFFLTLTWEQARLISTKIGIPVSEFIRSGMREKQSALPQVLVKLYHDNLDSTGAEKIPLRPELLYE
jgi:hypothetical protein